MTARDDERPSLEAPVEGCGKPDALEYERDQPIEQVCERER